jgi:uncharacterized membrane protein
MPELFPIFIFLHVLGAVVGLGPTFAFPVIGAMGGREPMHGNFATRVSHRIGDRVVEPALLSMPVTGVGLIWSRSIDLFAPGSRWLVLAIVVYVVAVTFAIFVQRKAVGRVIELTGGHGGGAAAPATASPGPGAQGGPPPELLAAIRQVQRGGLFLLILALVLIFLMVVKPSLGA